MSKTEERLILLSAIIILVGTIVICIKSCLALDKTFQVLAIVLAFEYFVYKLLAGWLISNLNIKIEPTRERIDGLSDHLAIKLYLAKGNIDSLWLTSINIRLSEVVSDDQGLNKVIKTIAPVGYKKRVLTVGDEWEGPILPYYTISIGEEACFSAYAKVKNGIVLIVEVLVLGTRLFYGVESNKRKLIQWRSSAIILPAQETNHPVAV